MQIVRPTAFDSFRTTTGTNLPSRSAHTHCTAPQIVRPTAFDSFRNFVKWRHTVTSVVWLVLSQVGCGEPLWAWFGLVGVEGAVRRTSGGTAWDRLPRSGLPCCRCVAGRGGMRVLSAARAGPPCLRHPPAQAARDSWVPNGSAAAVAAVGGSGGEASARTLLARWAGGASTRRGSQSQPARRRHSRRRIAAHLLHHHCRPHPLPALSTPTRLLPSCNQPLQAEGRAAPPGRAHSRRV